MNILWITNFPLPCVQKELSLTQNPKEGWLIQISEALSASETINLTIVSPSEEIGKVDERQIGKAYYITYPKAAVKNNIISIFTKINENRTPDVVHIQGSENIYGTKWIEANGNQNVVVSIQGMPSVYTRYFKAGISDWIWLRHTTIGDLIRGGNIPYMFKKFKKSGEIETNLLSKVRHVIGRTDWDKAHCWAINPNAKYHFCNETLRQSFYNYVWSYEKCEPHTIFISQATLPLKGAHKVLEAMGIVKKIYPDVTLKIAMCCNIDKTSIVNRFKRRNYGSLLNSYISKYGLKDNVRILGKLDEQQMLETYLSSNVFISPGSIENSPNSLGEAQLLGMPTIASYVGGTDNIADFGKATDLYRFEEVEMLAYKLVQLFEHGPDLKKIEYARRLALQRHDLQQNLMQLVQIYTSLTINV